MSQGDNDWISFYRAAHYLEAHALKDALETEGVAVRVHNDTSGVGENLSPLELIEVMLMIQPQDQKQASLIIERYQKRQGEGWYCSSCGELNKSQFDMCWRCKHEPGEAND